jgi:Fe-S-cluster-containing dehydrogenase component
VTDISRKNYILVIDALKCFDCKSCMVACKVENNVPNGRWRNWVKPAIGAKGRRFQFQPGQCMQCEAPACVAACPVRATYKRSDGMVVIDPTKCIGCGNCVTGCPYGARFWNPITRLAEKCDYCQHRLIQGEEPACVETCPTKARIFGDLKDPTSKVSALMKKGRLVQVKNTLIDTKPRIFYTAGTVQLNWPKEPTLPGDVHLPASFWKKG